MQTLNAPQALFTVVTPGYFEALGVPVVRGRDVADGDRPDAPFVAVVNEQLVSDAFPGVDPIGRTVRAGLDSLTPMTIVGVVKNVRTRGPARPVQAEIYFPFEQHPGPATALNLVVRARAGDPLAAGAAAARVIRSRHAEVPVRLEAMTTTLAAVHRHAALPHRTAGGVRGGGAGARRRRRLRRDGLHGEPAGAGDRPAGGARARRRATCSAWC